LVFFEVVISVLYQGTVLEGFWGLVKDGKLDVIAAKALRRLDQPFFDLIMFIYHSNRWLFVPLE
jgi:hypothetical protein